MNFILMLIKLDICKILHLAEFTQHTTKAKVGRLFSLLRSYCEIKQDKLPLVFQSLQWGNTEVMPLESSEISLFSELCGLPAHGDSDLKSVFMS